MSQATAPVNRFGLTDKKMEDVGVIMQTPITYSTAWIFHQPGGRCGEFEKQFIDCASQVGATRAKKDCILEKRDVDECGKMEIAYKRFTRMQEERQKQGRTYLEPPPYDTLRKENFKNIVFR